MRFMVIRKADPDTEAGMMPSDDLVVAMTRYNEQLIDAGIMKAGDGLKPSAQGVRVKFSDGTASVTDGPFAETKELVAGYSIWEVGSRDEAIEWMKRWPPLDGQGEVELELRPLWELTDFGAGAEIDRLVEVHQRLERP